MGRVLPRAERPPHFAAWALSLVALALTTVDIPTAVADAVDWPTFQGGPDFLGHRGSEPPALDDPAGWSVVVPGSVLPSPPIADGDRVLLAHGDGVSAFAAANGSLLWQSTAGGAASSGIALAGPMLLYGTPDGRIVALEVADGSVVWEHTLGAQVSGAPAVAGDGVFASWTGGPLVRLDLRTGEHVWTAEGGSGTPAPPTVSGGRVFVPSWDDGEIVALDAADGRLLWRHDVQPGSSALTVVGDTLFTSGNADELVALDVRRGERRWTVDTRVPVLPAPTVRDGALYVGDANGQMRAFDAETGRELWARRLRGHVSEEAAATAERVIVGDNLGWIYAIDPLSGRLLAERQLGTHVRTSPTVAGDVVFAHVGHHRLTPPDSVNEIRLHALHLTGTHNEVGGLEVAPIAILALAAAGMLLRRDRRN